MCEVLRALISNGTQIGASPRKHWGEAGSAGARCAPGIGMVFDRCCRPLTVICWRRQQANRNRLANEKTAPFRAVTPLEGECPKCDFAMSVVRHTFEPHSQPFVPSGGTNCTTCTEPTTRPSRSKRASHGRSPDAGGLIRPFVTSSASATRSMPICGRCCSL